MDFYRLMTPLLIFISITYEIYFTFQKLENCYMSSFNQSLYFHNYFGPTPKTNKYLLSYIQQYPIKHLTHLPPSKLFMFPESISCRPLPINNVELLFRKNQSQSRLGMKVNLLRNSQILSTRYKSLIWSKFHYSKRMFCIKICINDAKGFFIEHNNTFL